jgi:hypothetical protein
MTNERKTIEDVRQGRFARVQLRGGPAIDGFAAADPSDARFLRVDSLVADDDGNLSQLSLRLLPADIISVEVLANAPRFQGANGLVIVMPASFWSEDAG